MDQTCDLCGLPLGEDFVETENASFCCRGCHEVQRTLQDQEYDSSPSDNSQVMALEEGNERTYFQVPQMRCASCEAFLTARASNMDGVQQAEANYASEMVMVDYDPEQLTEEDIVRHLTTGGYKPSNPSLQESERSREVGRLLVGGFFGMMTMLWYVLFIYPKYLGVANENLLMDLSGTAGQYLYFNLLIMSGVIVFYTGAPILRGAWVGIRSAYPNMDVLIALAVLNAFLFSCLVLVRGGLEIYFDISVVVVLVVTFGRYFEKRLKESALSKVRELTSESVGTVRISTENSFDDVKPDEVQVGDRVLVKAGEEIPVDGTIRTGSGYVDESLVTGESQPVRREPGEDVLAGSLLRDGSITVEVTNNPDDSFINLLRNRMWEIQSSQFNYQKLADKLAAVFVPAVLLLAVAAFGGNLITGKTLEGSLLTAMTVLVVSCPCALGLATPMAMMTAFESLLNLGVAPRTAGAFEQNNSLKTVVLDKTGTITTDEMIVKTDGASERGIELAAAVESRSNHPLARSIESLGDTSHTVENVREYSGEGVVAEVDNYEVLVGNSDLFERHDYRRPTEITEAYEDARRQGSIPVLVGWDGDAQDLLTVEEAVRDELNPILDYVEENDLDVVVMTGDDRRGIESLINHSAITEVYREVKPEAKVKLIKKMMKDGPLMMVGDGRNDAPALAAASLGIAVGNRTALAASAADLVFVKDKLSPLIPALKIVRQAGSRVKQNLGWALLYNGLAIPAALLGYLNPLVAAGAMSISSLLVVVNSRRNFV